MVALALFLSSCASNPENTSGAADTRTQPQRIAEHQQLVSSLVDFRVEGGLGVWNDTESHSARLDWREASGARNIRFSGPGGLGSLRLKTQADGRASLQVGQNREVNGPSADVLLRQVLGLQVAVPVDQLGLWIRGLPGEAANVKHDDKGRLQSLSWQDESGVNWRVRIKSYSRLDAIPLPSLVTAQGSGYRMRIVLKDWKRALQSDVGNATEKEGDDRLF